MNPIDQFFNFVERCEHALVNLHTYFALMFIEMGIMAAFIKAVYLGKHIYAQVFIPKIKNTPSEYEREATSSVHVLRALTARQKILVRHPDDHRYDRHHHGILVDEPH